MHSMVRAATLFASLCWGSAWRLGQQRAQRLLNQPKLCALQLSSLLALSLQSPGLQHSRADGAVGLPASACLPTAAALAHST